MNEFIGGPIIYTKTLKSVYRNHISKLTVQSSKRTENRHHAPFLELFTGLVSIMCRWYLPFSTSWCAQPFMDDNVIHQWPELICVNCWWWSAMLTGGGSGISRGRGRRPSRGRQHMILPNFAKDCMKYRKFWAVGGGGGACQGRPP